ncbi:hypothetical protein ACFP6A_00085 [Quadrisphaera sp. GCM10027208]|uniref:hypothetical protein n=1 Tax=Quadrisphaera sp. GCM10027208 TaxID=3273423 RepID=UPI00361973D4
MDATEPVAVRVGVLTPSGRCDLAVPAGTPAGALLDALRVGDRLPGRLGGRDPGALRLMTATGTDVDPAEPVGGPVLGEGDVLVVVTARGSAAATGAGPLSPPAATTSPGPVRAGLLGGGVLALAGAVATALTAAPGDPLRTAAATVLLALAVALALLARTTTAGGPAVTLAPVLAGAGGWLLVVTDRPGWSLVALTAAAVAAAVTAVLARSARPVRDDGPGAVLLVELVVAVTAGAAAVLALVTGAGGAVLAALAAGLVLPLVRLLPAGVVDVPDDVLLELDRLAVTAWSVHGPRRSRSRRTRLRRQDVDGVVRRGRVLLAAWALAAAAVAVAAVALLVATPATGWARLGVLVLLGCLAVGLPLAARAVRERRPRALLSVAGVAGSVALAAELLPGATGWVAVAVVSVAVLAALSAAAAATAVGHGWGSVHWARAADVVEGLAVLLALPAAVVAAGAVEWLRAVVS